MKKLIVSISIIGAFAAPAAPSVGYKAATNIAEYAAAQATNALAATKQDTLVSGSNVKTINNQSLLGSGNIEIAGGGGGGMTIMNRIESTDGLSTIYADGSWVTRTNATVGVAATNALESAEHATATYQPKGNYLTSESDPTVGLTNNTVYASGTNRTFLVEHQSLSFTNDYRRTDAKIDWGDVTNHGDFVTETVTNGLMRAGDYHGDYITDGTNTVRADLTANLGTEQKSGWGFGTFDYSVPDFPTTGHLVFGSLYGDPAYTDGSNYIKEGTGGYDVFIDGFEGNIDSIESQSITISGYGMSATCHLVYSTSKEPIVGKLATTNDLYAVKTNAYTKSETDAAIIAATNTVGEQTIVRGEYDEYILGWDITAQFGYYAYNDIDGRPINSTYATKDEVPTSYLKSATSTENSITVTKQDDTTVGLEVQYDYALTNLTGIAVSLASGQIGNVTLDNTQTNLSLSLDFSSNTNRSGDCMLLAFCGAETTLAVGPSQAVDILGTYEKLKAGTNLVMVTRMMMNGTNSVVMVNVREVK